MRLKTPTVTVGNIKIGGNQPIAIQSMTNTNTADAVKTAEQCVQLAKAGSELVRLTVNNESSAAAIPEIRKIIDDYGFADLPLIGDFHFNGHKLLADFPKCAEKLDKYRINPGNVGYGDKHNYNFDRIIQIALANHKPVRIGVNWGSLDRDLLTELMVKNAGLISPLSDREVIIEAMVESAVRCCESAEKIGLQPDRIILSVKMSDVQDVVAAYEKLVTRLQKDGRMYALHLGLTEAGSGMQGVVSSTAALSILLKQGIGDTIRISLTPEKKAARSREVQVCKELLQSLGLRHFKPKVTSCPGCGRTDSNFFQKLAAEVNNHIQKNLPKWLKNNPRVSAMKIAVMGCVVNGPGESSHADIAISLPGNKEEKMAPVFLHGKYYKTLIGEDLSLQFIKIIDEFVQGYRK